MLAALGVGDAAAIEQIPLAGPLKLVNPLGALSFVLEGPDSHQPTIDAPPGFSSRWAAAEMAELYWMALTRGVQFVDFQEHGTIAGAVSDLNSFSDFRGPKDGGVVTPRTVFRGQTAGDLEGPYLSQLLLQPYKFGAVSMDQRCRVPLGLQSFLVGYDDWLHCQNGGAAVNSIEYDPVPRYIRCGLDLGEWVHQDFSYQGGLAAALVLLSYGAGALDENNPYRSLAKQSGFATLGAPDVLDLLARVSGAALRSAWYQKWLVHRRLRPEAFAARVHHKASGTFDYAISDEILGSASLFSLVASNGTYLLPLAYPEGCPAHPSYPAGHAVVAGAYCTVLKAFFNEEFVLPNPVLPSRDGVSLVAYEGPDLTVGGELNKLASNVAFGRNMAGVHWRSDAEQGLLLGEQVALGVLGDLHACYGERFGGLALTRFDGVRVTVA